MELFFLKFNFHDLNFLFVGVPIFTSIPPLLVTPKELTTLRQTCQAVGFPPPVLSWTRLGMPLPVGKSEVKDDSLTIRDLRPADSGLYECVAKNSMGTKKAKMNVTVRVRARDTVGTGELLGKPDKFRGSDLRFTSIPSRDGTDIDFPGSPVVPVFLSVLALPFLHFLLSVQ